MPAGPGIGWVDTDQIRGSRRGTPPPQSRTCIPSPPAARRCDARTGCRHYWVTLVGLLGPRRAKPRRTPRGATSGGRSQPRREWLAPQDRGEVRYSPRPRAPRVRLGRPGRDIRDRAKLPEPDPLLIAPTMTWQLDFNRYINAPHEAWPPGKPLQARKLEECRARRCSATRADLALMIDRACEAARRRLDANAPTLFLINCGSSGSHWVEAMLSALPGIHACGEVYVPPRIGGELAEAPASDRRCFLDALHQVHMDVPVEIAERDVLINSAHSWNPHDLMGEAAIPVVLVRDPVDVVASRTFRKPKLRRHPTWCPG